MDLYSAMIRKQINDACDNNYAGRPWSSTKTIRWIIYLTLTLLTTGRQVYWQPIL